MTGAAGWCGGIATFEQRRRVNAGRPIGNRSLVPTECAHPLRVPMTPCTRLRDVGRSDRRPRVSDARDPVRAVTVAACGHAGLTFAHLLAVDAGEVLCELIDAHLWIESPHVSRIAVTSGAQPSDVRPWRRRFRSLPRMAVGTRDARGAMHIAPHCVLGRLPARLSAHGCHRAEHDDAG